MFRSKSLKKSKYTRDTAADDIDMSVPSQDPQPPPPEPPRKRLTGRSLLPRLRGDRNKSRRRAHEETSALGRQAQRVVYSF